MCIFPGLYLSYPRFIMFLHNTSQTHDKENVWTCAWSYYSFFVIGKLQKRNKKICLNKAKQTILFLLFFPPQKSEVLRMTHLFVLRLLSVLLLSKSGLFLLDSLPTIISPLSFSFSIPPRCALSFYFHWTASRWDNILMALLTGKTPTADFH